MENIVANVPNNVVSFLSSSRNFSTELLFHSFNVALLARKIGESSGLSKSEVDELFMLGLLHDIGKSNTPDEILFKPGALNSEEREIMKAHSIESERIMLNIKGLYFDSNKSQEYGKILRGHHEKFIGTGYPDGLKGEEIHYMSKILTIADIFEAITSPRIYRRSIILDPIKLMDEEAGVSIDPYLYENYAKDVLLDYKNERYTQNILRGHII